MCGRFVMARAQGDLLAAANAERPEMLAPWSDDYNVAPTKSIPIIVERAVEPDEAEEPDPAAAPIMRREVHRAHWGLVPRWAKDMSFGSRTFNARSETAATKPSFRSAVRSQRCAVPVDGYYEWLAPNKDKAPKGTRKQPYFVHRADDEVIFFAGLYEWWPDPEVPEGDPSRWILSTTIVTADSPSPEAPGVLGALGLLHNRLPLPMNPQMMDTWLGSGRLESTEDAEALLEQVRAQAEDTILADQWQLRPVSPAVGNVRNNGPELLHELPDVGQPSQSPWL